MSKTPAWKEKSWKAKCHEGWRNIYWSLQNTEAVSVSYHIRIGYSWEGCMPMVDMSCAVYTKKDNKLCYPLSNHLHRKETPGMEIAVDEDVQITPQELAAGLLWEITYYGGTETISNENLKRIFNRNANE